MCWFDDVEFVSDDGDAVWDDDVLLCFFGFDDVDVSVDADSCSVGESFFEFGVGVLVL